MSRTAATKLRIARDLAGRGFGADAIAAQLHSSKDSVRAMLSRAERELGPPPRPPAAEPSGIESVTRMVFAASVFALQGGAWVPVSLPRVRFLEVRP